MLTRDKYLSIQISCFANQYQSFMWCIFSGSSLDGFVYHISREDNPTTSNSESDKNQSYSSPSSSQVSSQSTIQESGSCQHDTSNDTLESTQREDIAGVSTSLTSGDISANTDTTTHSSIPEVESQNDLKPLSSHIPRRTGESILCSRLNIDNPPRSVHSDGSQIQSQNSEESFLDHTLGSKSGSVVTFHAPNDKSNDINSVNMSEELDNDQYDSGNTVTHEEADFICHGSSTCPKDSDSSHQQPTVILVSLCYIRQRQVLTQCIFCECKCSNTEKLII